MDDREVVAAIVAGDRTRIAVVYDKYAAAIYGYCQFMLRGPADAAEALLDTFVVAVTTLAYVREPPSMRPWLYAVARRECRRRLRSRSAARSKVDDAANWPTDAADRRVDAARRPIPVTPHSRAARAVAAARKGQDRPDSLSQADLRMLVCGVVARLAPGQREVIELSLRHHLDDADLPIVLGISPGRAHVLAGHARGKLEKALGTLIANAGPDARPALNDLLVGWDGQVGEQAADREGAHFKQSQTSVVDRWGALGPVALLSLPPPAAALPPRLRERVLWLCTATTADAVAHRRQVARRAGPRWPIRVARTVRRARWNNIRAHPGGAAATAAVTVWAVAAATVTAVTFADFHPASNTAVRPSLSAPAGGSPAATIRPTPAALASASARPSPTRGTPPAVVPPSTGPSAARTPNATPLPSG